MTGSTVVGVGGLTLVTLLASSAAFAQSAPDWAAIRQRAVAAAQEIDAAQGRLAGALTADAMTSLLRSERFSIEQLALNASAARKDPGVLAAVIKHLFSRTEGIVVVTTKTGESIYLRLLKFDEFTGEVQYRAGNASPQAGRLTGVDLGFADLQLPSFGTCKGQLHFSPDLTASGTVDCSMAVPITVTFK